MQNGITMEVVIFLHSVYLHYKSVKDTLYQGENAKKIEIERFRYAGDSVQLDPMFVFDRNDSVFYYNDLYQRYILLYDFTASMGDTLFFNIPDTNWTYNWPNDSVFRVIVDSVSFVTVSGKSLKKIHTSQLDFHSFFGGYTEFIGSEFLMLPQTMAFVPLYYGPLRCYEDSSIFIQFTTQNCDHRIVVTSLKENNPLFNQIKIHPNPIDQYANIQVDGVKITSIKLMDILGQLVKEFSPKLERLNFIDVEDGIYFIHITTEDRRQFSKKMIVHH